MGRVVVSALVILQITIYIQSVLPLFGIHFWNRQYALSMFPNDTFLDETYRSYLTARYKFFLPHVIGAMLWWNLYYFQLIPSIRRKYKSFHRWLGRLLLLTAIVQTFSGIGMACYSTSSRIKIISMGVAISTTYCVYFSARYAIKRDIARHMFWAKRLVGYLQTISLQRFYIIALFIMQSMGCVGFLYPGSTGQLEDIVQDLFDDSFVLAFVTAVLGTELYLSYEADMMGAANLNYQLIQ